MENLEENLKLYSALKTNFQWGRKNLGDLNEIAETTYSKEALLLRAERDIMYEKLSILTQKIETLAKIIRSCITPENREQIANKYGTI